MICNNVLVDLLEGPIDVAPDYARSALSPESRPGTKEAVGAETLSITLCFWYAAVLLSAELCRFSYIISY